MSKTSKRKKSQAASAKPSLAEPENSAEHAQANLIVEPAIPAASGLPEASSLLNIQDMPLHDAEDEDEDEEISEDYKPTWSDQLGDLALRYKWALLGGILVLAALLRFFRVDARSLWYDESFTLTLAQRNLSDLLAGTANDYHPPLHYLLFGAWTALFGGSIDTARILSALLGVGAVGLVFGLAQEMFGTRTALLAALFAAVAPFQIAYSQEVRHYSLQFLLGTWLVWAFYRAWRRASWLDWGQFGLAAVLSLYNLYFSIFELAALGLFFVGWLIYERQRTGKWDKLRLTQWLVANAVAGLLFAPWALALVQQMGTVKKSYWIDMPNPLEIFRLTNVFLLNATNLTTDAPYALGGQLLGGLITVFLLYSLRFRLKKGEKGQRRRSAQVALLLVFWFGMAGLVLLASYIYTPLYLERSLIGVAAGCYVLLARVVQTARRPALWLFLLIPALVVLFGSLQSYYFSNVYSVHYENEQMLSAIQSEHQPGDTILHSSKLSFLPFAYLKAPVPGYLVPEEPGNSHDDLSLTTQRVIGLEYTPVSKTLEQGGKRLWWVRVLPQPGQTEKYLNEIQKEIETVYRLARQTEFWGATVYLYEKK